MHQTDLRAHFSPDSRNTISLSTHRTFSRADHTRSQTSLKKLKRVEITSTIFPKHNGLKLEISNNKKMGKFTNTWE